MSEESTQNIISQGINIVYSHGLAHVHEMLSDGSGRLIPVVLVWDENGRQEANVCLSDDAIGMGEKICKKAIQTCSCYVFLYTGTGENGQRVIVMKIFDVGSEYLVELAVPYSMEGGECSFSTPVLLGYTRNEYYDTESA